MCGSVGVFELIQKERARTHTEPKSGLLGQTKKHVEVTKSAANLFWSAPEDPLGPLGFNSPSIARRHALHVERTAEKADDVPVSFRCK